MYELEWGRGGAEDRRGAGGGVTAGEDKGEEGDGDETIGCNDYMPFICSQLLLHEALSARGGEGSLHVLSSAVALIKRLGERELCLVAARCARKTDGDLTPTPDHAPSLLLKIRPMMT